MELQLGAERARLDEETGFRVDPNGNVIRLRIRGATAGGAIRGSIPRTFESQAPPARARCSCSRVLRNNSCALGREKDRRSLPRAGRFPPR